MIRASRHTLIANIVQQLCAALLLLYLPNIFEKADYAQVVYVSVLLSFIGFADAGFSMAYGRVVPALIAQERHDEVKLWDSTTLRFGLVFSSFYSIVIALLYYVRYENLLNTFLLLPMPFIVFWFSFHIARFSANGNFRQYRIVNTWRSAASLIAFPLVFMSGITGFFISQLVAALLALFSLGKELFRPLGKPHWLLVKNHLPEGMMLALNAVLWMTLMNFARFYASMFYRPEHIATYGIISAAGMSLLSLVASLFLPVGVELRTRHGRNEQHALEFAREIISKSLPWIAATTLLSVIASPVLLSLCFPKYNFDKVLLAVTLLGIAFYPFLIVFGNLMIIRKQFIQYLIFVVISLLVSAASAYLIDRIGQINGAAYGQLIGIMAYAILLFIKVSDFSSAAYKLIWRKQAKALGMIYMLSILIIIAFNYL